MKNGKLKLEKGVPIPSGYKGELSELVILLKEMKPGDSFLYPLSTRHRVPTYAARAGVKITTRTVDKENIRVWRIK